jgi:hypothetical protein
VAVAGAGSPIAGFADYILTSRLVARPLHARVFDIGNPGAVFENSQDGVNLSVSGTLLLDLQVDPVADAPQCAALPRGPALRTQSGIAAGNQSFPSGASVVMIDGTNTQIQVSVPAPAKLALLYTAECAVAASNDSTWLELDLQVDGAAAPPTDSDQALCTSKAAGGNDTWVSARAVGLTTVGTGVHQITVQGQDVGSSSQWWIGDSALLIYVPEPPRGWLLFPGMALLAALSRWRRMRGLLPAGLALALVLANGSGARAQGLIAGTRNTNDQIFSDNLDHTLDLGSGSTFNVVTASSVRLAISFSAECTVAAAGGLTWVTVDIYVDGVALAPTAGTPDAFCTSDGTGSPSLDNWVSAATAAAVDMPVAGGHLIEVHASLQNGVAGDSFRIDDLALTVVGTELP